MRTFRKAHLLTEELIKKVVLKIKTDPVSFDAAGIFREVDAKQLENAAGNHAFDDHPEAFGIGVDEGHHIRAYFQENGGSQNVEFRDYIQSLIDSVQIC